MRRTLAASLLAVFVVVPERVQAAPPGSWATFGHDFQRTGHADGAGAMHAPKVAWTLAMGGILSTQQALVADITGDGMPETVTVSGGRVVATRASGTTLWSGGLIEPTSLLGVWDLDGSGSIQIVVDTEGGVLVLAGADGHVVTTLSGTGSSVQAAFAQEGTGGILILSASYGPVSAYDFRSGTSVTQPLWNIPTANFQASELVGDVDGDGIPDLVRSLAAGFEVDDPLTGNLKYSLPAMGPTAYYYFYELANVDGNPGDEIVAVDPSYIYSPSCGVYVLGVKGGALVTLWSATATPPAALGADFMTVSGAVASLDGSGTQLVYSQWNGSQWTTVIADAAAGTTLATIPGGFLQAVADVDGDGKAEIATRAGVSGNQSPEWSTISVYDFDSVQAGPVAKSWTLQSAHIVTTPAVQLPAPGIPAPVVADFDPATPGLELLVGVDESMVNSDTNLLTIHGADGSTAKNYSVPATVDVSAIAVTSDLTSATSMNDLVLAENDGTVHLLDNNLTDHVDFTAGTYANWLHAIANPTGDANLFMATSNGHMRWIDGRQLHADGTPYVRFDEPGVVSTLSTASVGYPSDPVALLGGASPSLVTFEQGPSNLTVVDHGLSGVANWSITLDPGSRVDVPGAYVMDLNGDGNDDVLLNLVSATSVPSLDAYDGTTGTLLNSLPLSSIVTGADELFTGSLVDVNGDGRLDLVAPEHSMNEVIAIDLFSQPFSGIWSTAQGSTPLAEDGTIGAVTTADGGAPTLFRSNGNNGVGPYELLSSGGSIVAVSAQDLPAQNGYDQNAAVMVAGSTSGVSDLISAGTASIGLSRIRRFSGTDMTTVWTQYVANGAVSSAAPSTGYSLRDPVAVDVNGDGVDDVVFGSDDGYLYALSSVDGSLIFAVQLGAPVSHVIAANIDLDPALELVASLADGRLVAVDDSYDANRDPSDAGADAESGADAAVDATADAGKDVADAAEKTEGGTGDGGLDGGVPGGAASGGGCGCSEAGSSAASYGALLSALGILAAFVRRARARRGSVN